MVPPTPQAFDAFGALLRHLRRCARITQRDLAIAVGYTFGHISRLEQGERRPDPSQIRARFIDALRVADDPEWAERLVELARRAQLSTPAEDAPPPGALARLVAPAATLARGRDVLLTKIVLPHLRDTLLPRETLLRQLDDWLMRALTLVVAPVGYGKTTLLATWLKRLTSAPIAEEAIAPLGAWLSLDARDNDPQTFARYLVAAFQSASPALGATAARLLLASEMPSLDAIVTALINDLIGCNRRVVLVLDDLHVITSVAIHRSLAFLLEHRPPSFHLVIASREVPALPLERLRAGGQVGELGSAHLRFSLAETSAFLRGAMGVPVSRAAIAALDAHTEGWPTGLQLAVLASQGHRGEVISAPAFTGANRFVVDYLATEVLERLPVHQRSFVLHTAILERMCGPLCDALLLGDGPAARSRDEPAYSQIVLEALERANLFLAPLDAERHWYRYHALFAEVARGLLANEFGTALAATLHRRASAWYERAGYSPEAAHHAAQAQRPQEQQLYRPGRPGSPSSPVRWGLL